MLFKINLNQLFALYKPPWCLTKSMSFFSFFCSKFTQSKRCLRDLITTSCSNGSRTSSLEFALVFDDFNPFCQGSVDQQAGNIIIFIQNMSKKL